MENKQSAIKGYTAQELHNKYNDPMQYNANRFLYNSIPQMQRPMGLGGKPAKYWITLRHWRKILTKIFKFEEVYIFLKKEKKYCLTYIN